jgi:hypothetical protein
MEYSVVGPIHVWSGRDDKNTPCGDKIPLLPGTQPIVAPILIYAGLVWAGCPINDIYRSH